MGLIPPELSLDCRPKTYIPHTIIEFLQEVSTMDNSVYEKTLKIEDYVKRLEDEMKKIDSFKRELPLCLLLVNDGNFPPFVLLILSLVGFSLNLSICIHSSKLG